MSLYSVKTERFGFVQVERDTIEEARRWAREALGVTNPRMVTRDNVAVHCHTCDSAPCVCQTRGA